MKIVFIILICSISLSGAIECEPNRLNVACVELRNSIYHEEFNRKNIQKDLDNFLEILKDIDSSSYISCNCADSLWVDSWQIDLKFKSEKESTHANFRLISSITETVDKANLNYELSSQSIETANDSFNYVIKRLNDKLSKKKQIYNLTTAEREYLKRERFTLLNSYFALIDDAEVEENVKVTILGALDNSNNFVANKLLNRIGRIEHSDQFYRMLGIIYRSSDSRPGEVKFQVLESINYRIEPEKLDFVLKGLSENLDKLTRKEKKRLKLILDKQNFEGYDFVQKLKGKLIKSR